jgi:Flp pilus assembly protein TadB
MSEQINESSGANTDVKEHLKSRNTWLRLVFMALFAVILYISNIVLFAVAILQFLSTLFTGDRNERLTDFGEKLGRFIYQVVRFLTFNTDEMPFPFADWPGDRP